MTTRTMTVMRYALLPSARYTPTVSCYALFGITFCSLLRRVRYIPYPATPCLMFIPYGAVPFLDMVLRHVRYAHTVRCDAKSGTDLGSLAAVCGL